MNSEKIDKNDCMWIQQRNYSSRRIQEEQDVTYIELFSLFFLFANLKLFF
jgi:hypothetical protein